MSFELFQLVPAVYRLRDAQIAQTMQLLTPAEQTELASLHTQATPLTDDQKALLTELTAKQARGPLQSLLMVIDEQLAAFAEDLDQFYDDLFIETCAKWVIPYIGDLIGYQSIRGITPSVDNPRTEVAETISLRRRKGTVLVLEQLARDVTGWGAHALEFFQVLGDTQYMKHVRPKNFYAPDVRSWKPQFYSNSGFSTMARKVDVHNLAAVGLPRTNIQNVGIYLWSLGAYSVTQGTPVPALDAGGAAICFRLSSLGMDMPLFHRAISQGEQITAPATEANVPDWLPRLLLCADMQKGVGASYYGEGASLALYLGGQLLNPYQIKVADLSSQTSGLWNNLPVAGSPFAALIDPDLGRVALPPSDTSTALTASYFYGFNGEMGGGEYERQDGFVVTDPAKIVTYTTTAFASLQDAITAAIALMGVEGKVALEIPDNATYTVATFGQLTIDLPKGTTLEVRAADGARPTLLLDGELAISGDANSVVILNGLLIGASAGMAPGTLATALVHVTPDRPSSLGTNLLSELSLTHCTLLPGWSVDASGNPKQPTQPTLVAEPSGVQIVSEYSILGAIQTDSLVTVNLSDSIVDATSNSSVAYSALDGASGGGALTLQGCTVVGKVHAETLTLVSNSIVWGALAPGDSWVSALVADRFQTGCVRFSFLPVGAVTPRRFECVEQALASAAPIFFSYRYGQPGYLKMLACTPDSIRHGADDGGEMGGFHFVLAPLRESDLTLRLQEYTPVGLDVGLVYQT